MSSNLDHELSYQDDPWLIVACVVLARLVIAALPTG